MSTQHNSFGYYQPDTAIVRAHKMDWSVAVAWNRPMPTDLIRFIQEDEP